MKRMEGDSEWSDDESDLKDEDLHKSEVNICERVSEQITHFDPRSASRLARNAEKRGAGVHDCVAPAKQTNPILKIDP